MKTYPGASTTSCIQYEQPINLSRKLSSLKASYGNASSPGCERTSQEFAVYAPRHTAAPEVANLGLGSIGGGERPPLASKITPASPPSRIKCTAFEHDPDRLRIIRPGASVYIDRTPNCPHDSAFSLAAV